MDSIKTASGLSWAAGAWLLAELLRGGIPWTPAFFLALSLLWVQARRNGGKLFDKDPEIAVFLIAAAAYLSTFRWHGGDDAPNSLIPFCIVRFHTLALDPVIDPWFIGKTHDFTLPFGPHLLSVHPVLPGIMAVPFYLPSLMAGVVPNERFLHNISKLCGTTFTAASAAFFFAAVRRRRCSQDWALCLTVLYAFGSWAFSVSSQALWQHGTASFGLALSLWALSRDGFWMDFLAGLGVAIAFGSRLDSVFFLAALGAYVLFHRTKRLPGFMTGAAVPLAVVFGYWIHYTGRLAPPETQLQSAIVTHFQPAALIGLLVSPTRGILFFFPPVLFGMWAAFRQRRDPLVVWLFLACLGPLALLTHYDNWVGGMTFGPRYFALVALCTTFFCAGVEKEIRWGQPSSLWGQAPERTLRLTAWVGLMMFSVLVHALGAYFTWPGPQAIEPEKAALWTFNLHPVAQLFVADGWLKALPAPVRWFIGASVLAAFIQLGNRLNKLLAKEKPRPFRT